MMGLDAKYIKNQLTTTFYKKIVLDLGGEIAKENSEEIIFSSICHHKDPQNHKKKLYLYIRSKTFKCFSCGESFDVISLISAVWNLCNKQYSFLDILNYIVDICDLDIETVTRNKPKSKNHICNWQDVLHRHIKYENKNTDMKIYDDNILRFFKQAYHIDWINDNISIETMQKFRVCWYPYAQQIVIPIYDDYGNFVGLYARNMISEIVSTGLKYCPVRLLCGKQYNFPISMVWYGLWQNKENIIKSKTAIIVESPKAVMQLEDILDKNISVGLFGTNLSKYKRNILINLGVEKFIIALDKQYKRWYDKEENSEDYQEFSKWKNTINKIIDMLKPYGTVEIVYDTKDLLKYKDSPTDKSKEIWDKLWEEREII